MGRRHTIISLISVYVLLAILLNSVGVVILQSIDYFKVTKTQAGILEGFKDLPIAIASLLLASQLSRIGLKRGLLLGLGLLLIGILLMPLANSFFMTKLHFACIGIAFGISKIVIYSTVGLVTEGKQEHASLLTMIEGFFVLGVLANYWVFSSFINDADPTSASWLNVYWWLAGACVLVMAIVTTMKLDEKQVSAGTDKGIVSAYADMLKIAGRPLILVFVISLFLYVLIEQSVGTWLPTFNNEVLGLPKKMSVQAASIFALAIAIGRLGAGFFLRYISWFWLIAGCLISMGVLILLTLPLTQDLPSMSAASWLSAPLPAYIFPMIGLFMAPIYPVVSSVTLSDLPKHEHPSATGLLVIFSALGGTVGSLVTGRVFEVAGGQTAFYAILLPIAVILVSLYILKRMIDKRES